jgi:hypothetical protein
MKKVTTESNLLVWSKPEVRRIDAGSAESNVKSGTPDGGGPGGSGKDFS